MASNVSYTNDKGFKAGMSYLVGNYATAIKEYTELLQIYPHTRQLHLYRALSYIKTKEYQLALEDINKEEEITKESFTLLLNKGICLFNLDKLIDAKAILTSALRLSIENEQRDRITPWLNKVNLEIKAKGIIESTNTGDLKIIVDWIQSATNVTVSLKSNHNLNEYDVNLQTKSITLLNKSSVICYEMKLTNSIIPKTSSYKVNGKSLELVLVKEVPNFNWVNVQVDVSAMNKQSVTGAYPTSAKVKKDWDKIDSEIDQELKTDMKADSNEGMMKLFKDIYERSDEKTRRAMIKSFQTSNGTVLSTNWDEVSSKDYEGKDRPEAPKGQEWANDK